LSNPNPDDRRPARTRTQAVAFALILLYFLTVRLVLLDQPFTRSPEGVSSYYGLLARNYLRYPLAEHKLVPVQSIGIEGTGSPVYYSHHPPPCSARAATRGRPSSRRRCSRRYR
jgi:hypothetical protein